MLQRSFAPYGMLDPFADMRRMQRDMNRMFAGLDAPQKPGQPAINFWAGQDSIVLTAELPGLSQEDIELTVKDGIVTLSGSYHDPETGEDAVWHRRERPQGRFSRSIELPFRIAPDRVEARFKDGVLTVEMQRPEEDKPKRIEIKAS